MSIISGRLGFRGRAHHSRCVGRAEQCDAAGAALGPGGRDYDEVHRVGGKASTQRTPEQTDIARLWITLGVPAWNPIARQLSSAKGLGVPHNARPFALFNLAGTDALIACWDSKSTHHGSHPVDAIRSGRRAGRAADPTWDRRSRRRRSPATSRATRASGAAQAVLEAEFGSGRSPR